MFPPKHDESERHGASEGEGGALFGGAGGAAGDEEGEEGAMVHIDHYAVKLQKARDLAAKDPKAIANMIKDWMGVNGN
jgi:flagellar M-ring protein FliF